MYGPCDQLSSTLDEIRDAGLWKHERALEETLLRNSTRLRTLMTDAGFDLLPGSHPIVPGMFPGDDGASRAAQVAEHMLAAGVYVVAFSFPVVPRGEARIRVQRSAAHTGDDIERCVGAFVAARSAVDASEAC